MLLLATLLSIASVICLYGAVKKVELNKKGMLLKLEMYPKLSSVASLVLLSISTILLSVTTGIAKGMIYSVLLWITIASLLLLFAPFLNRFISRNTNP